MMSTLVAEESMRATQPIAIGSGSLTQAAARDIMAGWERDIHRTSQARSAVAISPEMLKQFGIGYVIVPTKVQDA